MSEVILDTNVFVLYIIGQINPNKISTHKRTSIYTKEHYEYLLQIISSYDRMLICPNIASEVDNLLNNFSGDDRYNYLSLSKIIYKQSFEKYIQTLVASESWYYDSLGVTDSVVLLMAKECDLLISGDSKLCDHARTDDIKLFDFKEYVNNCSYR